MVGGVGLGVGVGGGCIVCREVMIGSEDLRNFAAVIIAVNTTLLNR